VAFEQKTAGALADHLVADLSKSVVPASRQNNLGHTRAGVWLITGQFVRVDQGSRALRGLIGLGAGGTKMETIVRVYDLSGRSKEPEITAMVGDYYAKSGGQPLRSEKKPKILAAR